MWPDTRLTDLLGIEHPILQAPMLGTCTPELAAAVSGAGGLGAYACGLLDADQVRDRAKAVARLTNAPVNLNFFVQTKLDAPATPQAMTALADQYRRAGLGDLPELPEPHAAAPDAQVIDAICEAAPRVVSFHFGLPAADDMARIKAAGSIVIATATTVAEARTLGAAGVDAIIAQGWEAGGHRGSHQPNLPGDGVGTMALVPQVVDAVDVPVIAAGGIGDARGIVAAMALGASGVQMGTAFLQSDEANPSDAHLARVAGGSDEATMFTDAVSGRCARGGKSDYALAMAPLVGQLPPFPDLYTITRPLLEAGAAEFLLFGQAAALGRAAPAGDLVRSLAAEAQALTQALAGPPRG